eukprot:sb/3466027/
MRVTGSFRGLANRKREIQPIPTIHGAKFASIAVKIARRDPLNRLSHLPGTIILLLIIYFVQTAQGRRVEQGNIYSRYLDPEILCQTPTKLLNPRDISSDLVISRDLSAADLESTSDTPLSSSEIDAVLASPAVILSLASSVFFEADLSLTSLVFLDGLGVLFQSLLLGDSLCDSLKSSSVFFSSVFFSVFSSVFSSVLSSVLSRVDDVTIFSEDLVGRFSGKIQQKIDGNLEGRLKIRNNISGSHSRIHRESSLVEGVSSRREGTSVEGVSMTDRAGDAGREGVPSLTGVEVPELYLMVLAVLSSGVIPLEWGWVGQRGDLQLWLMQLWLKEYISHRCMQLWLKDSFSHRCIQLWLKEM